MQGTRTSDSQDDQGINLDEAIRRNREQSPDGTAFLEPSGSVTWAAYDDSVTLFAAHLVKMGVERGEHIAMWIPDGVAVHVVLSASLRAGCVLTGIGARSGVRELRHLLEKSKSTTLITVPTMGEVKTADLFDQLAGEISRLTRYVDVYDVVPRPEGRVSSVPAGADLVAAGELLRGRRRRINELSLINSTSGTTGLPKCVAHDELRWLKYHEYAIDAGELRPAETCMSVVPAPFGFGLWTSHFTPILLGSKTVILPKFDPRLTLQMLQDEKVEIFMAVSTQFVMMLADPEFKSFDFGSLRVMFTGGEAVPYSKAAEFEEITGATIVNMYGSNETGVLSYTKVSDSADTRLTTCGHVIDEVEVRVFQENGEEILERGVAGRPASRGVVTSQGYFNDPHGQAQLYTSDGWMLMGDLVTVDEEGVLRIVGRTSDFIIRGGKNISAPAVEEEVLSMEGIARVAAVPIPDEVFGERVGIYVVAKGDIEVTLESVRAHLANNQVSREWFPEHLILVDELPTSSGGKLAKAQLREDVALRFANARRT